jgi:phage replication O-like protein O
MDATKKYPAGGAATSTGQEKSDGDYSDPTRSAGNSQAETIRDRIGPYTAIPNELLEAVIFEPLSKSEIKVYLAILRHTYGFHKFTDKLSVSQLIEMTGLSTRMTKYTVQNLEAKKMISVQRKRGRGHKNEVNSITVIQKSSSWVVQEKSKQYDNILKKRKELYKKSSAKVVQEKVSGARNPDLVVQENAFSGAIPCTHKRNTKETKTTTTENPGCGCENSFEKETPLASENEITPAVDSNLATEAERHGLSEDQLEYINLETDRVHQAGQIRSTKAAYKNGLKIKARDGLLDISDLDDLRAKAQEAAEQEEINRYTETMMAIQTEVVAGLPEDEARQMVEDMLAGRIKQWDVELQGAAYQVDAAGLDHMLSTEWPEIYTRAKAARIADQRAEKTNRLDALIEKMGAADACYMIVSEGESGDNWDLWEILESDYAEEWQTACKAHRFYGIALAEIEAGLPGKNINRQKSVDQKLKVLHQLGFYELYRDLTGRLDAAGIKYTQPLVY